MRRHTLIVGRARLARRVRSASAARTARPIPDRPAEIDRLAFGVEAYLDPDSRSATETLGKRLVGAALIRQEKHRDQDDHAADDHLERRWVEVIGETPIRCALPRFQTAFGVRGPDFVVC